MEDERVRVIKDLDLIVRAWERLEDFKEGRDII